MSGARGTRIRLVLFVVSLVGLASAMLPTLASAHIENASPSDSRATFVPGNVTTCAGVGFASDNQLSGESSESDGDVSGTVRTNAGTVQPGVGQELNVAITGPNVVIDAVVVKGGPAYNVYSNPAFLPPTLPPDQHYISPLNLGGNVPDISHWFVCYHLSTPPPVGSLTVLKTLILPNGIPVTPLPTGYTALVNCNDGNQAHQNVTVTFSGGGSDGVPVVTGIAEGTVCTVVEQNTGSFAAGTVVTYSPSGADTTGVTMPAGGALTVGITNDFSGVAVQTGSLAVFKVVVPGPSGAIVPATFTAHVDCDDGTSTDVILPGNGGAGTPTLTLPAGSLCFVQETGIESLPAGLNVTYSVGGTPPMTAVPSVEIVADQTVTITINNDFTNVQAAALVMQPRFAG